MIKTLLIGLGAIGVGYDLQNRSDDIVLTHAKALSSHPEFELIAGVDSDTKNRQVFFENYKKPVYESIEKSALHINSIDLIIIATPTNTHLEIIDKILLHLQPKAVLCEKPLAYNLIEAEIINKKCQFNNIKLYVNYIRRCDPGAIYVKNLINSGDFISPIKGIAWYSKGFIHNGSHFFNLLEFWLGKFKSHKIIQKGRTIDKIDSEPDVHVIFEKGEITFLSAWEEYFSHYSIELLSASGRINYAHGGQKISIQHVRRDTLMPGFFQLQKNEEAIDNQMARYQINVLNQFFNAYTGLENTLCTGHEGLGTIRAMNEILQLK